MTAQGPPPGWYHRDGSAARVWWDGQQWTEHRTMPDVSTRQVQGATVSDITQRRIKWAGVHWGGAPPAAMLTLGIVILASVPVGLLLMLLAGSRGWWDTGFRLVILVLIVLLGVAMIVEAHFGFKLRKLQRPHTPQG